MTDETRKLLSLPALEVAPRLLGMILKVGNTSGRIVEVEAYTQDDPASHSFRGKTPRNAPMFLPGGHLYVYFSYGNHWCVNIVTGKEGVGEAVLIRALEPLTGIPLMRRRRKIAQKERLCSGPGNVGRALGLTGRFSGVRIGTLGIDLLPGDPPPEIWVTTRVGVRNGADLPRRFLYPGSPCLSRPLPKNFVKILLHSPKTVLY
ncbi:MAG: DNA-3-methyladenine glycosylase [Fimbriimonadales bacterium]|nr:DNA-3-methyladenine glycosylase [Fimbriimonadales bacterium]